MGVWALVMLMVIGVVGVFGAVAILVEHQQAFLDSDLRSRETRQIILSKQDEQIRLLTLICRNLMPRDAGGDGRDACADG